MKTVDAMRVGPARKGTAERIEQAWWQARPAVRRATASAMLTSVALAMLWSPDWWVRSTVALTGTTLAVAALVDLHEFRLPNRLMWIAAAATFSAPALRLDVGMTSRTLAGGLVAAGLMLLVQVRRGVGMGDVKMSAVVGASAGSMAILGAPIAIAIASLVAASCGLVSRQRRMALGPALWLGWATALFVLSAGW